MSRRNNLVVEGGRRYTRVAGGAGGRRGRIVATFALLHARYESAAHTAKKRVSKMPGRVNLISRIEPSEEMEGGMKPGIATAEKRNA